MEKWIADAGKEQEYTAGQDLYYPEAEQCYLRVHKLRD